MATDDTDRYPTTSKFPKTRPTELTSKQGESGQQIELVANYIKMLAAPKCIQKKISHFYFNTFLSSRGFISLSLHVRTRGMFSLFVCNHKTIFDRLTDRTTKNSS